MENAEAERDIYDELLTQAEIQGNVNKVNGKLHQHTHTLCGICWILWCTRGNADLSPTVNNALSEAEQALLSGDEDKLYEALKAMGIQNLQPQNKAWYLKQLQGDRENKEQVGSTV